MQTKEILRQLCLAHAPSGYEREAAKVYAELIAPFVDDISVDRAGNVVARQEGTDPNAPVIMVYAHLDTLGFIVRRIEPDGFIQVDRLGGIPEKVLPALRLKIRTTKGQFVPGLIGNKAHHATGADEKYKVDVVTSLFIDVGAKSAEEVRAMGIEIGCPAIYEPCFYELAGQSVSGTAIDNRGGVAAMILAARQLGESPHPSTVLFVGTVWEEFNIRGAVFAARANKVDIGLCLDVVLAGDTPELKGRYDNRLGGGPTINTYSFHGRGTLNGTLPHEGLLKLARSVAEKDNIPVQQFASLGIIVDSAYVQMERDHVASLDLGFACRYTHSPVETCCLSDIEGLANLVAGIAGRVDASFDLNRYRL
ncbi:MAG: M42 family peptidase [Christensenellales bacterium]|jgi:putative aminopeptidase FrvX